MTSQPPPAAGVRFPWPDLPPRIRAALEDWLGAPVESAVTQPGGFSPGAAVRIRATNGQRVFIKAIGPEPNTDSPDIHRREAHVVTRLPESAPVPRLLWTYDEGPAGWVMLVFEDIEGWNPVQPWRADELNRVLAALVPLSTALTPSAIEADTASNAFATAIQGWQRLQAQPLDGLDRWSVRHLDALAALEAAAPGAVAGDTLLHFDLRADNILLTPDHVYVVDWPHAAIGAAWVDLIGFAPSVAMQGGPDPEVLLGRFHPALDADPRAITATVASLAGYFTHKALLPPPPGIPTVRAFQAAQGVVARRWLAERTGWT